jgi:hypothetical protein
VVDDTRARAPCAVGARAREQRGQRHLTIRLALLVSAAGPAAAIWAAGRAGGGGRRNVAEQHWQQPDVLAVSSDARSAGKSMRGPWFRGFMV